MIDAIDFTIPGIGVFKNKLGITTQPLCESGDGVNGFCALPRLQATPVSRRLRLRPPFRRSTTRFIKTSTIGPES